MHRRSELNRNIAHALSAVLLPELTAIVQSYSPLADVVFVLGGLQELFADPHASIETLTFPGADVTRADERVRVERTPDAFELSTGTEGAACAAVNDCIYVIGGFSVRLTFLSTVSCIDPFASSSDWRWTKCPEPAQTVFGGAAVAVGAVLYVFGGSNLSELATSHVWRYDTKRTVDSATATETDGWVLLPQRMASAKESCDACLTADGRAIFLNDLGSRGSPIVEVFDVQSETFKPTLLLPAQSPKGSAICYFRDSVWLIGGFTSLDEVSVVRRLRDPLAAVLTTRTIGGGDRRLNWETESPLIVARSHCRVVVVDDSMHVIGGNTGVGASVRTGIASIESYDSATQRWVMQKAALTTGRYNFALAHCH